MRLMSGSCEGITPPNKEAILSAINSPSMSANANDDGIERGKALGDATRTGGEKPMLFVTVYMFFSYIRCFMEP